MAASDRPLRKCRARAAAMLAAAVGAAISSQALAATATVSVSATQAGVTPLYLGFNMGHYMSTSNTSAWTQYQSPSGFRVWANATDYEVNNTPGDGVTTLTQFQTNKSVVRANPETNPIIPWVSYNAGWGQTQSGRNHVQLNYILPELQKLGVEPVMQLSRSAGTMATWGSKWDQWEFYYTVAYWSAKNYDVQRFQMWNEPDLTSNETIGEWVDRLKLASDAVKSAIEDVNRDYNKQLSWSMNAPVAADQDGTIDTWGAAALQANRTDYAGNPTTYDIFDTYDVHRYNALGGSYAADQQLFDSKIPGYNASGQNLPVTYTEFNRFNSSSGSWSATGLDNVQHAAEFGTIFPKGMSEDVFGMYAFKFHQTLWDHDENNGTPDVPQKTGFHFVEDTGLNNTRSATRGGEVMRMVIKAFKGQRPRMVPSVSATNANYEAATSHDQARGNYFYYAANRDTTNSYTTNLDLSSWDVATGQILALTEVSGTHMGGVKQYITVPANKQISFSQPATSVVLLTIPSGQAVQTRTDLIATEDAYVSKANPTVNQGANLTTAKIDRNASTTADDVTYLKFNHGATAKANVARAILNVTGANTANSTSTILHVYGILTDTWFENTITWNTAPNLGSGAADSKLLNVGSDAFPVGQMVWNSSTNEWGLDVTEFVRRQQADANVSFVLIREERFSGDADTSVITINSSENAAGQPKLSLFTTTTGLFEWKKNQAGTTHTWSTASNWDVGAPTSSSSSIALLGDFVTAPQTVNLTSPTTLGELRFDGLNGYTLTGSSTLTLGTGISTFKGSHKLDTPVTMSAASTVRVETGANLTISKAVSGSAAMTKIGGGTLTFTSPQSFGPVSNALVINGGVVNVNSTFSRGINVATGGTLSGTGSISGAVVASGKIAPGGVNVVGSTTFSGGITLNAGSSLDFDFGLNGFDKITGTSTLTLSGGTDTIAINLSDIGGLGDGDYPLINHSSALANIDALYIGAHPAGTFELLNNPGAIVLRVTDIGVAPRIWFGTVDNVWDHDNTQNWSGATGKFLNGDGVRLSDAATGSTNITVAASGVSPGSIAVENEAKNYTIGGPGSINGATGITKDGAGNLTLTGTNAFTGAVVVNDGTLTLASGAAVGSASNVTLNGANLAFSAATNLTRNVIISAASTVAVGTNSVTMSGVVSGAGALSMTGSGTLVLAGANGGFSGGIDITSGTVRGTVVDALGAGPINVTNGTVQADYTFSGAVPAIILSDGGTFAATGSVTYSKSNYPAIPLGTAGTPVTAAFAAINASDELLFNSAIRNTVTGASTSIIRVNPNGEAGWVVLRSGGQSSANSLTFSGDWTLNGGVLQMGPSNASTGETLNALGFKNGDAMQANAITVTAGKLVGAINTPHPTHTTTPSFFRTNVTLQGGTIGSTTLNANYGGDFIVQPGSSQVIVYDPSSLYPNTPRDVSLVAGAAGPFNNTAVTTWSGGIVVTPLSASVGGTFRILRDGGTISVNPGGMLTINSGASVELGGTVDALSDGVDHVNVNNNSAAGFNVTAGTKNIGSLDGTGTTTVSPSVTLIARRLRQGTFNANGPVTVRDSGSIATASDIGTINVGAGGKIDLRDNDLIVRTQTVGTWNGTDYSGVQQLARRGYNGGAWNGAGLVTSLDDADVDHVTTLAVAAAGDVGKTSFAARSVAADDVLVMYTWAGDADLNDRVDADDYFRIDAGYASRATGYAFGDFDYSGSIDGDDYFVIDAGYNAQFAPAPPALTGVTSVPEPSAFACALAGAMTTLAARRRRR